MMEQADDCFDGWVDNWSKQAKKKRTVAGVTSPVAGGTGRKPDIRTRASSTSAAGSATWRRRPFHAAHPRPSASSCRKAVEEARRLAADRGWRTASLPGRRRSEGRVAEGRHRRLEPGVLLLSGHRWAATNSLSAAGVAYAFADERRRRRGWRARSPSCGCGSPMPGTASVMTSSEGSGSSSTTTEGDNSGVGYRRRVSARSAPGRCSGGLAPGRVCQAVSPPGARPLHRMVQIEQGAELGGVPDREVSVAVVHEDMWSSGLGGQLLRPGPTPASSCSE